MAVMNATLNPPVIRGDGTPETVWLAWLDTLAPRLVTLDEWVAVGERLVVVSPHPDDEVLACGGLLAMHAARGGDVLIVAITDGGKSHGVIGTAEEDALARARRAESAVGLSRLSSQPISVRRLAISDGGVAPAKLAVQQTLSALLRPEDVVVTTWRNDAHPDHDAAGAATAAACRETGCRLLEAPVWMWNWASPDDGRVPWHRLRGVSLDVDARAAKQAALSAHVTQLTPRPLELEPVLGPSIIARASREIEFFFV